MDPQERQLILEHIERWRRVSEFMEKERGEVLQSMTDEDTRAAVVALFSIPAPLFEDHGSGLVEQQRILHGKR